jgi:hypothetical protein
MLYPPADVSSLPRVARSAKAGRKALKHDDLSTQSSLPRRRLHAPSPPHVLTALLTRSPTRRPHSLRPSGRPTATIPAGCASLPLTELTPANVGDLKVAWCNHMRPAPPPARPPTPPPNSGTRARPWLWIRGQRRHTAGDRRGHVHRHSIRPRGRTRLEYGQGAVGVPGALRLHRHLAESSTGPATTQRRRHRSFSERVTAASSPFTPELVSRTRASATVASSA